MTMLRDNLPYSEKGMKHLASALGITTSQFWVDPATGSLRLKTEPTSQIRPQPLVLDEVDED